MYKKSSALTILCLVFAVFAVSIGVRILLLKSKYVNCNKYCIGEAMSEEVTTVISDYEQLLSELNTKYFGQVCDIFDDAKTQLVAKLKEVLGSDYIELNEQIKALKDSSLQLRTAFDNEPYTVELKEKLENAKIEFVEAPDEQTRLEKKQALNSVLSEIADRNLKIFSQMGEIRKQIDEKCLLAAEIVKSKEEQFKKLEKDIIAEAKKRTLELAVSYKSEVSALSFAFDVKDYCTEMPFLSTFDPNMKLMDFDKNAFVAAFADRKDNCGAGCSHNCKSCHQALATGEDKNYFTSVQNDEFKN